MRLHAQACATLFVAALLAPAPSAAQAPELHRVLHLPPPHDANGAFVILGPAEDPPRRASVVTIQNARHLSDSTEAPSITPARHLEVVFGPPRTGAVRGTLFPCRGRTVTASRTVWIRDRLRSDPWRRGVEARATGQCELLARFAGGGPVALLPGRRPVSVAVVEILDDEAERARARAALGVEQVEVHRIAGRSRVVRFARDNGWHYAVLAGSVARTLNLHHVVEAYYPQSGPFVPCIGGRAYLMDRLGGAFEGPPYQLVDVGACPADTGR